MNVLLEPRRPSILDPQRLLDGVRVEGVDLTFPERSSRIVPGSIRA